MKITIVFFSSRFFFLDLKEMSFLKHSWKTLNLSIADRILTISMNRPKANAMSPELLNELIHAFRQASHDQQIRGVHLRSNLK